MLSLSCIPASAETCPEFLQVLKILFMGTLSGYETALQPFNPDPEMKEAGMQMKTLLDTLPLETKVNILRLSVNGILHSQRVQVASPSPSATMSPHLSASFLIQWGQSHDQWRAQASRHRPSLWAFSLFLPF